MQNHIPTPVAMLKNTARLAAALATLWATPLLAHGGATATPATPSLAAATTSAQISTPEDVVTAFHAALSRGDTDTALAQLAEDVLIFESGGVERSRAEYAAHHLMADAAFSSAVRRTLVSRTGGDDANTAWLTSVEDVTGSFRNRPINSRSIETMLLRRINGRWQIVHIHWSSADIKPS